MISHLILIYFYMHYCTFPTHNCTMRTDVCCLNKINIINNMPLLAGKNNPNNNSTKTCTQLIRSSNSNIIEQKNIRLERNIFKILAAQVVGLVTIMNLHPTKTWLCWNVWMKWLGHHVPNILDGVISIRIFFSNSLRNFKKGLLGVSLKSYHYLFSRGFYKF